MLGRRGWIGVRPNVSLLRSFLVYGLKSHSGNIAGQVNARADQALISLFMAPASLGLYSVAVTITGLIGLLTSPLGQVAFPAVAGGHSPAERAQQASAFVRGSLIISALAAGALALGAPLLIGLFFGSAFLPAVQAAEVLLLAAVFLGVSRVLGDALRGFNKPLVPGVSEGIAAVVTLISLGLLLPLLGIMGAAIASLLAYATSFAYMVWFCDARLGIPPSALLIPRRADFVWLGNRLMETWAIMRSRLAE
jgi:O-antigen/teichoic acid export membrane protein